MVKHDQQADSQASYWAVVPAAGIGKRMNSAVPKQYLKLNGREVLAWTLQSLQALDRLQGIVLVLHPHDEYYKQNLAAHFPQVRAVRGGDERIHSVLAGLEALDEQVDGRDWVLVHDAVRPCLRISDLQKLLKGLVDSETGGILASPVKDTLKKANTQGQITQTLNRDEYWLAATPQMFRYQLLRTALQQALEAGVLVTDEAAAMERLGYPVSVVSGRADNIKITSAEDLSLAEFILAKQVSAGTAAVSQEID